MVTIRATQHRRRRPTRSLTPSGACALGKKLNPSSQRGLASRHVPRPGGIALSSPSAANEKGHGFRTSTLPPSGPWMPAVPSGRPPPSGAGSPHRPHGTRRKPRASLGTPCLVPVPKPSAPVMVSGCWQAAQDIVGLGGAGRRGRLCPGMWEGPPPEPPLCLFLLEC